MPDMLTMSGLGLALDIMPESDFKEATILEKAKKTSAGLFRVRRLNPLRYFRSNDI